jgi:putative aminopeptidase FrvX
MTPPADRPAIDLERLVGDLIALLEVPSPTGFTDDAIAWLEGALAPLGLAHRRTPKGALLWTIPGGDGPERAIACHVDTLGAVVAEIKRTGRLRLSRLGGYDWSTAEGAECELRTHAGRTFTGTVVNVKQSTHVHGPALRTLERDDAAMELRLDAAVANADDVRALGVAVGDPVAFLSQPRRTEHGFVKGRHLDNKASVAVCLEVTRALVASAARPPGDVHVFVSTYEEVGHGAAAGIPAASQELLCLDMAAVGRGQASREDAATLCVKDSSGPYDARMNRALRDLAQREGIELVTDVYPYYGSDASAAWRAGGDWRAALIGPGVDASHAYERTHERALEASARLTLAWILDA